MERVRPKVARTEKDISIAEASQYYDACAECVGKDVSSYAKIGFFDVLIRCENELKILARDSDFTNNTEFERVVHALKESNHQGLQQLAHSLKCVNPVMQQRLWCRLDTMTNLIKAILSLCPNEENFVQMLKDCCDANLKNISSLVKEEDKVRTEKSLEQLKEAVTYGRWQFGSCEDILQGKKNHELVLEITTIVWHYDEIGKNIDRILFEIDGKELKGIEVVIKQFGECKEISAFQVELWKKGGRIYNHNNYDSSDNEVLYLSVNSQMSTFTTCKDLWQQRLSQWKEHAFQLREKFPALNYFRFNEIHSLIYQIDTFLSPKCLGRSLQAAKSIKPFLQKINCQVTDKDIDKILQDWRYFNCDILKSYDLYNISDREDFKECRDAIARFGLILQPLWACLPSDRVERPCPILLNVGKPNLILYPHKSLLLKVFGLFESHEYIPRAEHILICNEHTAEEDVTCLIFRAISSDKRMQTETTNMEMDNGFVKPLYCLMYPEKLAPETLDQVCKSVHSILLDDVQSEKLKHCCYMFAVMSCERDNLLCKLLEPFCVSLSNISLRTLPNKVLSRFYRNNWANPQSHSIDTEPPWIQLYTSKQVGMGKSTLIQRDIEKIRKIHENSTKTIKEICVAFNSKDIDWIQIMDNLWSYHPCPEDSLIIYHLNISSCVSVQINDFLFELLFLQHIDSNSQISQCFHVNSNMIFLIEIPSTLDNLSPNEMFFNLFSRVIQFPNVEVSNLNNSFEFGMDAQYTIKWMQQYFEGNLEFSYIFFAFFLTKTTCIHPDVHFKKKS
ncbi:ring finger protein [Reticulomyxa filosa]|uniref:Ring finger protein n=1 Tax=Reticulomyxa filosa TaxID=46433 RepID=X6LI23_RETFI|nr:ring finger protein [Reticulomyxa filosa]|eukprot:ETO01001.1 ring finger protein [Reticulomyxa filosa]